MRDCFVVGYVDVVSVGGDDGHGVLSFYNCCVV